MKKVLMGIGMCFSVCLCLLGTCSTAVGAWASSGGTTNYVTTPTFGTEIIEEYNPPASVFPGQYIDKVVNIKNTGDIQALVRVSLEKYFEDESLDPEMIVLDINEDDWKYVNGYYYYKDILGSGETTKSPLLRGFMIDPSAGMEYTIQDAHIVVNSESVQYANEGISVWEDVSYEMLSIQEPSPPNITPQDTKVIFLDKNKGFNIELTKDDLFLNFKELLPGDIKTQHIRVSNNYSEPVLIRLSGMLSKDSSEELRNLMFKYVTIEITDDTGDVVYKGAIGGDSKFSAVLGVFASKEERLYAVKAYVSKDLDSSFYNLVGSVDWEFTAIEADKEYLEVDQTIDIVEDEVPLAKTTVPKSPTVFAKTDVTRLFYVGVVMTVVGILGILAFRRRSRVEK